jgi:hypothetical protein
MVQITRTMCVAALVPSPERHQHLARNLGEQSASVESTPASCDESSIGFGP